MKPILKWPGGKALQVSEILAVLPRKIVTYYEPFVGGAAVFLALAEAGRFEQACISDTNQELIDTYSAVRACPELVIEELRRLTRKPITEKSYYKLRASRPKEISTRAARMLVLNKTCYNGLYRVNRSGQFNVPFGDYKNPGIFDEGHIRAFAQLLRGVSIIQDHYLWAIAAAEPGDVVYLDPPYLPVAGAKPGTGFRGYTPNGFGDEQHILLSSHVRILTRRGVGWALSNSNNALSRLLYEEKATKIKELDARRNISSKASTRGKVKELLIWNKLHRAA